MTMGTATIGSARSSRWTQRYLPVVSIAAAVLIAVAVLPSALNVPQSNPTETLEFAPVPPDEDQPPPPSGNLSSLGLAGTGTLEGGGLLGGDEGGGPGLGDTLEGIGKSPRTKDCVIHPDLDGDGQQDLRQTEDPLSPPCVADFRGDNFGATWQGVTGEEIRILIYFQGALLYTNICRDPNQSTPDNQYFDLFQEPEPGEHCVVRVMRTWQRYFADRWQSYGRLPHFFLYFSGSGDFAEERRADAAENFAKVKPFAVVNFGESHVEAYLEVMSRRGVLNFGSFLSRSEEFFQRFPGLVWGYFPSLDKKAEAFASYLCSKVEPHPVSFSRNPGENGGPRKYAMWRTDDPEHPELQALAALTKELVRERCGMEFALERTFPEAGFVHSNETSPRHATEAAAEFRAEGVTTVIWPGGLETNFTKQSAAINYFPEIVALGDGELEKETSGLFQDQSAWDQAHVVTSLTIEGDIRRSVCYRAFREVDSDSDDTEIRGVACPAYPHLRQLFTGIQVAGPRLRPETVEQGYRAIPELRSTSPQLPACFYDPGDYTCVKDAMVERWDRTANEGQGCFRATEAGTRYFPGTWPPGDVLAQERPDDPCNEYDGNFTVNPAPPDDPTAF